MRLSLSLTWVVAFGGLLSSGVALAGDKPVQVPTSAPSSGASASGAASASVPPSGPETADSLYNQGNDAYDHGDYLLALELYTGAFKLRKSYDVARNLGLTESKLKHFKKAIEYFEYSVEHYPSNRPDTKKQVVDWLASAKMEVGALGLTVDPVNGVCQVNGVVVRNEAPFKDQMVDPGDVQVECGGLDGFTTVRRVVKVAKGAREEVNIVLLPMGGGRRGQTSDSSKEQWKNLVWVGASVAAAGLGVGIVTGILSIAKAGEANGLLTEMKTASGRMSPCLSPAESGCSDLLALRKEQDVFGNIAFWTLLSGGILGAGTGTFAYLMFRTEDEKGGAPPPKVLLTPMISPNSAALVFSGSF